MQTIIIRAITKYIEDKRVIIKTKSFKINEIENGSSWSNCLYLEFIKELFPFNIYPSLVEGFSENTKRFNYYDCELNEIPWHGGITYYKENLSLESNKTVVTVGCDYMHYRDEYVYGNRDCGEDIIQSDGEEIFKAFSELVERKMKSLESGE